MEIEILLFPKPALLCPRHTFNSKTNSERESLKKKKNNTKRTQSSRENQVETCMTVCVWLFQWHKQRGETMILMAKHLWYLISTFCVLRSGLSWSWRCWRNLSPNIKKSIFHLKITCLPIPSFTIWIPDKTLCFWQWRFVDLTLLEKRFTISNFLGFDKLQWSTKEATLQNLWMSFSS